MKEIRLDVHGFRLALDEHGSGTVESDLLTAGFRGAGAGEAVEDFMIETGVYVAAANTIESFVLACACEGIAVAAPEFQRALETVCDAVGNEYGA